MGKSKRNYKKKEEVSTKTILKLILGLLLVVMFSTVIFFGYFAGFVKKNAETNTLPEGFTYNLINETNTAQKVETSTEIKEDNKDKEKETDDNKKEQKDKQETKKEKKDTDSKKEKTEDTNKNKKKE